MGWLETDNRAISVQLNLTGTATGTELGKIKIPMILTKIYLDLKIISLKITESLKNT